MEELGSKFDVEEVPQDQHPAKYRSEHLSSHAPSSNQSDLASLLVVLVWLLPLCLC